MRTIVQISTNQQNQSVILTLDDGSQVELFISELEKLKITPEKSAISALPDFELSSALQEALIRGVVNRLQVQDIADLTNRGFARLQTEGNLLKDTYPNYWDFLVNYRLEIGDPNVT